MRKKRQIDIKNRYLQLIIDLGYDYDGCDTVEDLKDLIDGLVDYACRARFNDDTSEVYTGFDGKIYNILHEKLGKGGKTWFLKQNMKK